MNAYAYPNPNGDGDAPLRPFYVLPYSILSATYDGYRHHDDVQEHDDGELIGETVEELAARVEALIRTVVASWGQVSNERDPVRLAETLAWKGRLVALHAQRSDRRPLACVERPPGEEHRYLAFGPHRIELRESPNVAPELDETDPAWVRLAKVEVEAIDALVVHMAGRQARAQARAEADALVRKREQLKRLKAELGD